jgi:phage terminase Nu1 subunit (DNA packaging protein)
MTTDRICNKAQLAEFFEISLPTVDAWMRKGCPVVARGHRGIGYQFDLLHVLLWFHIYQHRPQVHVDYDLAVKAHNLLREAEGR